MVSTKVIQLSEEQQAAHDTLVRFARGDEREHLMMVFTGYAGTGKTTTITEIVRSLKMEKEFFDDFPPGNKRDYSIVMSAPTHKAVRVMRKFSSFTNEVTFATIHSLLGLREDVGDDGKLRYVQSKDPEDSKIEQFDIVFIDETSMLSDELFRLLVPYAKQGKKIIFVGDPCQIPPVNHLDCIPFKPEAQKTYRIGAIGLTTIMRQAAGNPILAYATAIRQSYKTTRQFPVHSNTVMLPDGQHGIVKINTGDEPAIKAVLKQYFCSQEFRDDADFMKVIAWRNVIVDGVNAEVRKLLYPDQETLPFIMLGEKLIIDKPVILGRNILLTTNEEVTVVSYTVKSADFEYLTGVKDEYNNVNGAMETATFQYYDTVVEYYDGTNKRLEVNIRILHEDDQAKMTAIINSIAALAKAVEFGKPLKNKLWVSFYKVQRLFANVKYNYAVTSHKAQGSTYDNCLMMDWDIDRNTRIEERNRIKYVAATRARNLLLIVN